MQRIWAKNELKPHVTKTFKLSNDPKFEEKFWDVIGLYLDPPAKALVLCCDEKSQCQALERTQLGLPLAPKRPRTMLNRTVSHPGMTGLGQESAFKFIELMSAKDLKPEICPAHPNRHRFHPRGFSFWIWHVEEGAPLFPGGTGGMGGTARKSQGFFCPTAVPPAAGRWDSYDIETANAAKVPDEGGYPIFPVVQVVRWYTK